MQRRDIGRRLADGVSAKLEFDYVCERGHSFGEYHLHGVMNEIISAIISPKDFIPRSGYAHQALASESEKTVGRKREVDFYIQAHDPESTDVCIEAKWAGSSHCTWDRILLDLCRLALVKEHSPTTECLFVLSGPSSAVDASITSLTKNMPLYQSRGILESPKKGRNIPRTYRLKDWGGRFAGNELVLNGLPKKKNGRPNVPVKIMTVLVRSSSTHTANWQTVAWRII